MERIDGFTMLGSPVQVPTEGAFRKAEAELGIRLPASYRAMLHTFGSGQFGESCWILPPSDLQTYGSLLGEGYVEGELAGMLLFASRDDGHHWGWSARDLAAGAEPPVRHIPRVFDFEDTKVVAASVSDLVANWREEMVSEKARPYFVPTCPLMLVGDVPANGPHERLELPGALRLLSGEGRSVFFCEEAALLLSIQTVRAAHRTTPWTSTMRFRFLRSSSVGRARPLLDALVDTGWMFVKAPRITFVWRDAHGRDDVVRLFAHHGVTLAT